MESLMKTGMLFLFVWLIPFSGFSQKGNRWKKIKPEQNMVICNETDSWVLTFEDNFDTDSLDLTKWEAWREGSITGSGAQEYNTPDNLIFSDGILKIVAKKETVTQRSIPWLSDNEILPDGNPNLREFYFTSSKIRTKEQFLYGKLEARIKIAKGWGFFPAFWMFSGNPWNEIDVFEFWNEKNPKDLSNTIHMNMHDERNKVKKMHSTAYKGVDFSEDFHVFTLIREKNKTEWYLDGILIRTDYQYKKSRTNIDCQLIAGKKYKESQVYPPNPMLIFVNFAIQSGENAPDQTTTFPAYMEVDYVRFYQKK